MKKIILLFVTFITFISNTYGLDINSKNAVMYNLNDNTVVFEKNKDQVTSIASLTKIMTVLVAIENISDYDKNVTITSNMLSGLREQSLAVVGLKENQNVTYNDLLYAAFLASGADAVRGLTYSISGNEEDFVKLMNEKAQQLNLKNTVFENPIGLDDEKQHSTVDEVAILLNEAMKNEKFKEIFFSKSYTFKDKSKTVYSTVFSIANSIDSSVNYILGGKTGFTYGAGRCLASIALDENNNIKYLLVTTNADINGSNHVKDAINIYNYYFQNYKYQEIIKKDDTLVELKIKNDPKTVKKIKAKEPILLYLPNDYDKNEIKINYNGIEKLNYGMKKDTKIGYIDISYKNKIYKKVDVVLDENVNFSLINFIKNNIITISIFIIILLFVIKMY